MFPDCLQTSDAWEVVELPISENHSLRIVIHPGGLLKKTYWHIVGRVRGTFKSIDLLAFGPKNTQAIFGTMWISRIDSKKGIFDIWFSKFEDPVEGILILLHEIGHLRSHKSGARRWKTISQEERDAWAYAFRMMRKLSQMCDYKFLTKENKKGFLNTMYSFGWAQSPYKGKSIKP